MKDWMKKLGALCLTAAMSASTLTACSLDDYDENLLDLVVSKPTITAVSYDEKTGLHTILVEGLATNSLEVDCDYAFVTVLFYDELGDRMDCYGSQSIEKLFIGETWHYAVLVETQEMPASHEVSSHAYCY